ncbi:MAG: hypothetical protein KatS3mg129_3217 [Leptospiraceae bacterium]|nr:MAG: hypothetical protein KatS3mg129_3217 [Leptospiraceae bacterium]
MNFDLIYNQYKKILISYLVQIVHNKELAEDILQDSMIKFWKNYHKYHCKDGNYLPVLFEICKNTAYDFIRKEKHIQINKSISMEYIKDHKNILEEIHILDKLNLIVSQIEDQDLKELYYLLLDAKIKKKDLAKKMNISDRHLRRKVKKLIETIQNKIKENEEIKS